MLHVKKMKVMLFALTCAVFPVMVSAAHADAKADEKVNLKACEIKICGLIVSKKAEADNVTCDLVKTWGKDEIAAGTVGKSMKWSWGDAQCSVKFALPAQAMLDALAADKKELVTEPTDVSCQVGSGEKKDALTFKMAPKLSFEKGKVVDAKLGITDVAGPFMQRMTIKAAALIEKTSLFKKAAVKEANKFILRCPGKLKAAAK